MQRRGRPSTQPPKLRDGFYIELKTQGSSSAIKIIRKNMDTTLWLLLSILSIKSMISFQEIH